MKRIYGFLGALTNPFLIASMLMTSLPATAKVHYRGFVEGGLGVTSVSGQKDRKDNGGGVKFGYVVATTHGIQLKNNFFGLGVGIEPRYGAVGSYTRTTSLGGLTVTNTVDEGCMSRIALPVYANWRYDFFNSGDWSPYVGIKIGYYMHLSNFDFEFPNGYIGYGLYSYRYDYRIYSWIQGPHSDTAVDMFVSLDLGFRRKISRNAGVSFGLSIQTANNAEAEIKGQDWGGYSWDGYGWGNVGGLQVDMRNQLGISVLAKIAFDF